MSQDQKISSIAQMSKEEMNDALQLHSTALLKELHEAAIRQVEFEMARKNRLDVKASNLLLVAILSLTVVSFLWVYLMGTRQAIVIPLVVLMTITILCGVFCLGLSMKVLWVREGETYTVNERALFSKSHLSDADAEDQVEQQQALSMFYRTMTPHLWIISQKQNNLNDAKAVMLHRGQISYMVFIVFMYIFVLLAGLWR